MKNRILFNPETGRLSLNDNDLHCGTPLLVLIAGEWQHTRLELDAEDRWYLVGYPDIGPYGREAKEEC